MGDEPLDYEVGLPCVTCWGEGKDWGPYPTPKKVIATFSGVQAAGVNPPFPNGVGFTLVQQDPSVCTWAGTFPGQGPGGSDINISWSVGAANNSQLWAWGPAPYGQMFLDNTGVKCSTSFTNEFTVPPSRYGNGFGAVT